MFFDSGFIIFSDVSDIRERPIGYVIIDQAYIIFSYMLHLTAVGIDIL